MSILMQVMQQSERSTGHRVVIAEDDPAIAELVQIRMELAGYRTRLAKNASQALDEVFSFKPHCVVLDIGLPGRGGLGLLEHLRARLLDPAMRLQHIASTRVVGSVVS